jgi:hypothetical protein
MYKQLLCLALLAIPEAALADETWAERTDVGLHLGAAFATLGGSELNDPAVDYSYRTGFAGGGLLAVSMAYNLTAQLEVNFAAKGFRGDTDLPSTSGTSYMGYLEIPVLMRFGIPITKVIEPWVCVGPALGIFLDASFAYDDGRRNDDVADRIERIDIGLMVGTGVAMNVGQIGALIFDLRYNLGLRDWSKISTSENTVLNRAIYLTVGYRADLATLGRLFGNASH